MRKKLAASNLTQARTYVRQWAPYLTHTLYGLVNYPVEDLTSKVGGPLAVTENMVLLFDPTWVEQQDVLVLATGLAHECYHCQLRHMSRGAKYSDQKRWNLAADLFINGIMGKQEKKKGELMWSFPEWACMPESYGLPVGLSADAYYALLEGKTPQIGKLLAGSCGGICGTPIDLQLEKEANNAVGRSPANCRAIARATAHEIKKNEGRLGRGTRPGSISELIDISPETFFINWAARLGSVLRAAYGTVKTGGTDFSRRRPSKRSYLRGIILPGLVAYDPAVLFIVDSSGSMGRKQLSAALRIMSDIMHQLGMESAYFMEADVKTQRAPTPITASELATVEIKGRGGTNFVQPLQAADTMRPRPSLVVYLTDGDGSAPKEPPKAQRVVWCIVPTPYRVRPAPWGDLVVVSDDQEVVRQYYGDDELDIAM